MTVASLADLIRLKERVDRPQDREDVARLREIAQQSHGGRGIVVKDHPAGDGWEAATWEGARRARVRAQARLPPAARLAWLEEALLLAQRTGALARRRAERAATERAAAERAR